MLCVCQVSGPPVVFPDAVSSHSWAWVIPWHTHARQGWQQRGRLCPKSVPRRLALSSIKHSHFYFFPKTKDKELFFPFISTYLEINKILQHAFDTHLSDVELYISKQLWLTVGSRRYWDTMRALRCEAVERKSTPPPRGNYIFRCRGKPKGTARSY